MVKAASMLKLLAFFCLVLATNAILWESKMPMPKADPNADPDADLDRESPDIPDVDPPEETPEPDLEPEREMDPSVPLVMEVWMVNAVSVRDEEIIKTNPCPGGAPAHKRCQKDGDCLYGFECMGGADGEDMFCCAADEKILRFATCPGVSTPCANKWCSNDTDCRDMANCVMEFDVPKELLDAAKKDHDTEVDYKSRVGICCTDKDVIPDGLKSCPKGRSPSRRGPCGLSIPACPLGSECMYAGELFGRCCGAPESDVKTAESYHFRPLLTLGGIGRSGHFSYQKPRLDHISRRRYRYGRK